jgi:cyclase
MIPILTFNGFALVKTKQFSNPRMVGNPVQSARVFNSRNVDELIFLDIFSTKQNRKINLKVAKEVIKECFMPVGIGGGINSLEDIDNLLKIGADKVIIKTEAIKNPIFVKEASSFYGSQCISIAVDVLKENDQYVIYNSLGLVVTLEKFVKDVTFYGAGELILNSVTHDGMMNGFDTELYNYVSNLCNIPIVNVGGGGNLDHFKDLFQQTKCDAVAASSIFYFTQFTPLDIKATLKNLDKPVRL